MNLLSASTLSITPPMGPLVGRVTLPGSKSITNRALLVAALADGTSTLTGALKSEDTALMATALGQLGVQIDEPDDTTFVVQGRGGQLSRATEPLYLGNAGTAVRFLTAACCLVAGETQITGSDRMQRRPIQPLIDALRQLGVQIDATDGCPPVHIHSTGILTGSEVVIDGTVSSQFISALIMLLPYAVEETRLVMYGEIGSRGYLDITANVMAAFEVPPLPSSDGFRIPHKKYRAHTYAIEPDASGATYLWAAEKLTGGAISFANDPGSWSQPDARARDIMQAFPQSFGVVDGSQIQDAIPTLAVMAAFADGTTRFTGIENLRVKECDRTAALATELNKIKPGIAVEEEDDLIIYGDRDLARTGRPALISTYRDHRIAMSFSLAGLMMPGITIHDPGCVAKTFPTYWDTLKGLGVEIVERAHF